MQTVMCHELLWATRMYLKDTVAEKYNRHRLSNIFKKQTGQHYLRKCLKRSRSLFLLLQLEKKNLLIISVFQITTILLFSFTVYFF